MTESLPTTTKTVYRRVIGDYDKDSGDDLRQKHRDAFISYVKTGITENRLHPDMADKFNLEVLADTLDIDRDELFVYAGLDGLLNRYALKNTKGKAMETPQFFFMRIAMGLAYNEKDPTAYAKKFYKNVSARVYCRWLDQSRRGYHETLTFKLLPARDSRRYGAYRKVSVRCDVALKRVWGIGASITARAAGSPLKSSFVGFKWADTVRQDY